MTDTSFHASTALLRAIDIDFQVRLKAVQAEYDEEMAPLRSEFNRKRQQAETRRTRRLEMVTRWRDNMVKRAGATPVEVVGPHAG